MQGVTDSESVRDSQQSRLRQPVRRDPLTYYYSRFRYANTLRYQSFVDVHVALVVCVCISISKICELLRYVMVFWAHHFVPLILLNMACSLTAIE